MTSVRPPEPSGDVTAALDIAMAVEVAAALGGSALTQILERTPDGIMIIDAERRCIYANPTAGRMLARSPEGLVGQKLPADVLGGTELGAAPSTGRLLAADGTERAVVSFTFVVDLADAPHTVAVFRDLDEPRTAVRTALALAQTVSRLAGTATTDEILTGIARHAVEGTRALSAGISVLGGGHGPGVGGNYGPRGPAYSHVGPSWSAADDARGVAVIAAMTAGAITAGGEPGKAVVLSDARSAWEADPVMAPFAHDMRRFDWQGAICAPLAWDNRVIGVLGVYLPAGMAGPSEAELAFCSTLADQAAIAVSNARLSARASQAAALAERGRLARELHDSVSQALFSMTMHARAAELSLAKNGVRATTPLSRSVGQLSELARGILAEMRALIFELRPQALAEEGLVGALVKQAAALSARERLSVTVEGPTHSLDLAAEAEEHIYRIAAEALHNVVKHADATTAAVTVTATAAGVQVVVRDDGTGFDPHGSFDGHLGLSTMAERAAAIGADLAVSSTRSARAGPDDRPGTLVTLTVPVGARVRWDS